jgi:hypothetical protein
MADQKYIYPNIPDKTVEQQIDDKLVNLRKFDNKTNMIKEIKQYFENEEKHYKKKYNSTKIKSYVILSSEVILTAAGTALGTTLTLTGVGATIGVPVGTGCIAASTLLTKGIHEIIKKKEQSYLKMCLLSQASLEEFDKLYKKAMEDNTIDDKEYNQLTNKYETYKNSKSDLKKKTLKPLTNTNCNSNNTKRYFLDA